MISNKLAEKIYNVIRLAGHLAGYSIDIRKITKSGFPNHVPEDFIKKLSKIRDMTVVPWEGMYMSYQAAYYVANQGIEGDIVECGVWRGGGSMMMAETAHAIDIQNGRRRKFY